MKSRGTEATGKRQTFDPFKRNCSILVVGATSRMIAFPAAHARLARRAGAIESSPPPQYAKMLQASVEPQSCATLSCRLLSKQTSFLVYCEQMGDDLCANGLQALAVVRRRCALATRNCLMSQGLAKASQACVARLPSLKPRSLKGWGFSF